MTKRVKRVMRVICWTITVAAAVLGIVGTRGAELNWIVIGLALHFLPLVAQLIPLASARTTGVWLAVFLLLQALATPLVSPSDFKTLPPNLVRQFDVRGEVMAGIQGFQRVTTDGMGFRVTKPVAYHSKPEKTLRIFAIGASTTEQIQLDDRKTWTHLLQEKLQAALPGASVEVVNTGVSGLRAPNYLATLTSVYKYDPDIVLFLIGINDWNKQIKEAFGSDHYRKSQSDELRAALQFRNTLIGRLFRLLRQEFYPRSLSGAANVQTMIERGDYFSRQNNSLNRSDVRELDISEIAPDYQVALERIAGECKRHARITCVFITQPTAYRKDAPEAIRRRFWMTPPEERYTLSLDAMEGIADRYNGYLLNFSRRHEFVACDIAAALPPTTEVFFDDCHFNEQGAWRFARELDACLTHQLGGKLMPVSR